MLVVRLSLTVRAHFDVFLWRRRAGWPKEWSKENIGRFERKYPTTTWIPEQTAVWSGLVSEAGFFPSNLANLAMSHSCFVDALFATGESQRNQIWGGALQMIPTVKETHDHRSRQFFLDLFGGIPRKRSWFFSGNMLVGQAFASESMLFIFHHLSIG